jgi:hypothetical protein
MQSLLCAGSGFKPVAPARRHAKAFTHLNGQLVESRLVGDGLEP